LRHIIGHGRRSAKILKEIGFKLTQEEFLAIRFHMSLRGKESHPLYNEALKSLLRYVVHKADGKSAKLYKGYEDPAAQNTQDCMQPYTQDIIHLILKEAIYQVDGGWFMNLNSPYEGGVDPSWKNKISGLKGYDVAHLHGINDSIIGAIFILESGDKKGLFVLHHCFGMQGGAYFSPDKDPFVYSDIKIYCDWRDWNDYGYAACKQHNGWKLVKVTQFPMPEYTVLGEGFASAEEAMKSIGVEDCEKYLEKF
jgi:hypothetical protein